MYYINVTSIITHAESVGRCGYDVWVRPFGRLFVQSMTQKTSVQSWCGVDILGYPRNGMVWELKGQGHTINKCIFHTNIWSASTQKRMIPC